MGRRVTPKIANGLIRRYVAQNVPFSMLTWTHEERLKSTLLYKILTEENKYRLFFDRVMFPSFATNLYPVLLGFESLLL